MHTADIHGRLSDARAEALGRLLRSLDAPALLLDSGDALPTGNVDLRLGGEPTLARMSRLGYAAMALGNREFHPFVRLLKAKLVSARFPVLCANVRFARGAPASVRPSRVVELGGVTVGIFGLLTPMVRAGSFLERLCKISFDEPLRAAERIARELRPRCDLLVALTHIGIARDRELFDRLPEVDLVLGGHSHVREQQTAPGRALVHTAPYAQEATVIHWQGREAPPEVRVVALGEG